MNNQLTLSQLESYLWEAANILRGSPVDRTDWKSYILPLLFFKRICDVWDEEYIEALDEIAAQDYSLSIPLYVKRNGVVREEQGEYKTQSLKQLWQAWEQDGRLFWQEMDELVKMLGGLKG